ncbi:MAG: F0F1 ATP synthase subunit epsilon [Clostridium sartagoforme]|nr:F0F1 ATP synthase subunit epsilon [Clostridium sartagoforme]
MSNTFKITIASQEKSSMEYEAEALITSTKDGQIEFKYNHAPIIVSTIPTTTTIINGDSREEVFTSYGIVYVKNNEIKFICDAAEKSYDIDTARAMASKERAEKRLEERKDVDIERAIRSLARANARINTNKIND